MLAICLLVSVYMHVNGDGVWIPEKVVEVILVGEVGEDDN